MHLISRHRVALTAIGAALTLGLVGCGSSTPTAEPSQTPSTSPSGTPRTVTAYFIGDTTRGPRIYPERHTVVTTADAPTAAVETALGAPLDPDYRSAWTSLDVSVNSVTKSRGTIDVDLHGIATLRKPPAGMGPAMASAALNQILWTVKDAYTAGGRVAVQLLSDGSHIDRLLGIPVAEPLALGDPAQVLAQVWISNIEEGDTVTSPVHVEGLGAAFEAQLVWRVFDTSGKVVKQGFTMAAECCRLAPYSFDVRLTPGTYTLEVSDTDPSGGEGAGLWQDTKKFTVS